MLGFNDPHGRLDWEVAKRHAVHAKTSRLVRFSGSEFLVHLVISEDLGRLFGAGPLHTDNHPYLEFSAPRILYQGTGAVEALIGERRSLSTETKDFLDRHNDIETRLDLVEFAASANVPMFKNVLPWPQLEPGQKQRYREMVVDYCRRVLVPAYDIFDCPELKSACARVQATAIEKKIGTDTHASAIDHYNLALAQIARGKKKTAETLLQKAIRLDPDNGTALTVLGLLMAEAGAFDRAAGLLTTAVERSPHRKDPYKYLGMVELRRKFPERAIASLSTALRLSPGDSVILSELGTAYYLQGEPEKGGCLFEQSPCRQSPGQAEPVLPEPGQTEVERVIYGVGARVLPGFQTPARSRRLLCASRC